MGGRKMITIHNNEEPLYKLVKEKWDKHGN